MSITIRSGAATALQLVVTDYTTGGSKIIVRVRVMDAAGKLHAEFDVYQSANTLMGTLNWFFRSTSGASFLA